MSTSPIGQVLSRFAGVRKIGGSFVALCPAHDDKTPSLSIDEGDDGRVLLCCHAGCHLDAILAGAKLGLADLFPPKATNGHKAGDEIIATYPYVDESGNLLFEVVRKTGKKFLQRRPDGKGGWEWKTRGTRRVLFNLPDVIDAVAAGVTVYVVEGEKDALAIGRAGEVATCNPMGAGEWKAEHGYAEFLRGGHVVIVVDQDAPGISHAADVEASLVGVAASVRVVRPAVGKDAYDHLEAGKGLEDFVDVANEDDQINQEERDSLRERVRVGATRSLVSGAAFVLDVPETIEAVWGDESGAIAWSKGEYMLVNGPTGVGKSTLIQQVGMARLGLRGGAVLGMAIEPDDRPVLYLAIDRPAQIARSIQRMVSEKDRPLLEARLKVWGGPLPASIVKEPEMLAVMAEEVGAGMVIVDSLKDLAPKLSDEEVGQLVKQALSAPCSAGIEVAALHHQRKKQQGGGKPTSIDDVYGSTFITAGAGSVLLAWGEPGDAVVELSHLKQPGEAIGPLTLLHDHTIGLTTVQGTVDLWDVVRTSNGLTAEGAARALFGSVSPERNQIEKARRRLDGLVKKGKVYKEEPSKDSGGRQTEARYYLVCQRSDQGACSECGRMVWNTGGDVSPGYVCEVCERLKEGPVILHGKLVDPEEWRRGEVAS